MKYRILIPCPGMGVVRRGYETALEQCAIVLRESELFDVLVMGGAAVPPVDQVIPLFKRSWLSWASGIVSPARAYTLEQYSFFFMAKNKIRQFDPHIVYLSDDMLARLFYEHREALGGKYRILFRNGAPLSPPFDFCDHIHQGHPLHYAGALEMGESPEKMTLQPEAFNLDLTSRKPEGDELRSLRNSLGLPADRTIIIAIGAIGPKYKRFNYIIEEVAKVDPPPFLVILGEREGKAARIESLAHRLLGDGVMFRTVAPKMVRQYIQASDLFVHGALSEGFGRVIVEAAIEGIPCLLHDAKVYRCLLHDFPYYADFSEPGALAALIRSCLRGEVDSERQNAQREFVFEQYSWKSLAPNFIRMIQDQADLAQGRP